MKSGYLLLPLLVSGSLFAAGTLDVSAGYQSRYMLQGYDLLTQGSLLYHEVAISEGGFSASFWYAEGEDDPLLQETVLHWGYGRPFGPLYVYGGYTWLHYSDQFADSEWSLSIDGSPLSWLHMMTQAYYSRETEGTFYELALDHEMALPWADASISPSAVLGLNDGYVSHHENGVHHLDLKLEGRLPLRWGVSLTAGLHETLPLQEEDLAGSELEPAFSYGLGLLWSR